MSKKLLSEAQVRRFQNLASIRTINEMYNEEEMQEAETNEGMYSEEAPVEEAEEAELPPVEMDAEEPAEEEAPELDDAEGEQVEVEEEMVEKAAAALGDLQALLDALGGEAAPAADLAPVEMPDAPEAPEAPEMEMDAEEEEEDALLESDIEVTENNETNLTQEDIVKEVAKRVASRLLEAKEAQAKLNRALGRK